MDIFVPELLGTAMLLLLGCGVVANVALAKTNGFNGGFLLVNFGWGIGVFAGVYIAFASGAHLNPAVTIGLITSGNDLGGDTFVKAIVYIVAQFIGAFLGGVLAWLAYKEHFDDPETEVPAKLAVFFTNAGIRSNGWNIVTEAIGTFVLVFVVISFGKTPSGLGPLAVALLVVGIGASLGGPTGYAINPARDLGPRIAHFVLPIKNKGDSNWSYSWIPVVGPIIGAVIAGLLARVVDFV